MWKWIKGYKSMGWGAALVFLGGLQQSDLVGIVPPQYIGVVLMAIGVLNMTIRVATTTPVGVSEPQPLPSEVLAAVQAVKTEVQTVITGPIQAAEPRRGA